MTGKHLDQWELCYSLRNDQKHLVAVITAHWIISSQNINIQVNLGFIYLLDLMKKLRKEEKMFKKSAITCSKCSVLRTESHNS